MTRPLIGITADIVDTDYRLKRTLPAAVLAAGGLPVILAADAARVGDWLDRLDGLVLSGGDDPATEPFGEPTHPKATRIHDDRQAFETALLEQARRRPELPVLGVCLGMQMMGLAAGGHLDQHLPDTTTTADDHWGRRDHAVEGALGRGVVHSHHRQALTDPGTLTVVATAPDTIIEAVRDDRRPFYLGVQWHPERTDDPAMGLRLFEWLVEASVS